MKRSYEPLSNQMFINTFHLFNGLHKQREREFIFDEPRSLERRHFRDVYKHRYEEEAILKPKTEKI